MYTLTKQIYSQHSQKLLYDVANDTERYKDFVPFCSESEVIEDLGDEKHCRLLFAKGPIARELVTRNLLTPNESIEVSLLRGDFSHLSGKWTFEPYEEGTMVHLYFEYEFSNFLLQQTFGQLFKPLTEELIYIFSKRADQCST